MKRLNLFFEMGKDYGVIFLRDDTVRLYTNAGYALNNHGATAIGKKFNLPISIIILLTLHAGGI